MTITLANTRTPRRKDKPQQRKPAKPPEPKGKRKAVKPRELQPASPGNYVTKARSPLVPTRTNGPGDDDMDDDETAGI